MGAGGRVRLELPRAGVVRRSRAPHPTSAQPRDPRAGRALARVHDGPRRGARRTRHAGSRALRPWITPSDSPRNVSGGGRSASPCRPRSWPSRSSPPPPRDVKGASAREPGSQLLASGESSVDTGPTRSANPVGSVVDPSVATSPDQGSAPPITTAGGDVPEAVAAESHSSTAIHIQWRDVPTATAYSIKRADEPPGITTSWAFVTRTKGDVTDYTDQHLEPATTYWYRVSAITTSGAAVASDIVSATTSVAPPEAPSVMAVATSTTVDLSWADGASETGYRIERSTEDSIGWTVIGTTGTDVTAYTDSALLPETTYLYRVVATNAGGDSPPSAVVSVTTLEEKTDGGTVPEPSPGSDNGGGGGPKDGGRVPIGDGAAAIVEDGVAAIEGASLRLRPRPRRVSPPSRTRSPPSTRAPPPTRPDSRPRPTSPVPGPLRVTRSVTIPEKELRWRFSRSSGPGGQSVNTADSRVQLSLDLMTTTALGPVQRARALERLGRSAHRRRAHDHRAGGTVAAAESRGRGGTAEGHPRGGARPTTPHAPAHEARQAGRRPAHRREEATREDQEAPSRRRGVAAYSVWSRPRLIAYRISS